MKWHDGITLPNQESWSSVASILGITEEEFPSLASVLIPGTATALRPMLQPITSEYCVTWPYAGLWLVTCSPPAAWPGRWWGWRGSPAPPSLAPGTRTTFPLQHRHFIMNPLKFLVFSSEMQLVCKKNKNEERLIEFFSIIVSFHYLVMSHFTSLLDPTSWLHVPLLSWPVRSFQHDINHHHEVSCVWVGDKLVPTFA